MSSAISIFPIPCHPLLDLICVLGETFPQLAGVGGDPCPDVVGVLLHHGLQLHGVPAHLLPGLGHVLVEFVGQLLHVDGETLSCLLGVGAQLGLQVFFVHVQFTHAVLDQGAVVRRRDEVV